MVIEYTAMPSDVAALYSYTRKHSFKHAFLFYILPLAMAGLVLVEHISPNHSLTWSDWTTAAIWGVVAFLGFPLVLRLRTKKDKRTLSIQPDKLSTSVGRLSGDVPWTRVDRIEVTDEHIFVIGKNMNGFAIPRRAFLNDAQRNEFISLCQQYQQAARKL